MGLDNSKCLYVGRMVTNSLSESVGCLFHKRILLDLTNPFLGKVVEKVVSLQLQQGLEQADYLDSFQSRFKSGHSIEMVLIKIVNDFWCG